MDLKRFCEICIDACGLFLLAFVVVVFWVVTP